MNSSTNLGLKVIGTSLAAWGLGLIQLCAAPPSGPGSGSLQISPHRVVLEDPAPGKASERKGPPGSAGRSAEVLLINGGKEPATYRISFKYLKMDENGGVAERARQPGEVTAEDLIRYAPRQVVLEPGATQTVRIQVRKPQGLAPGEYRAHMLFRAVPAAAPEKPDDPERKDTEEEGVSVDIKPVYGLSIPVIVRHGATQVRVSLAELRLDPPAKEGEPPLLHLRILREGNRSVLGNLVATWRPSTGLPAKVGAFNNLPVYTDITRRNVVMELEGLKGKAPGTGSLKVEFVERETRKTLAESVLELPAKAAP